MGLLDLRPYCPNFRRQYRKVPGAILYARQVTPFHCE
jgi:hypothetical protein